ncbi:hypothetical protein LCGC14_1449090 [marine sediment metagenome]|uniref:Uncharacterized protein n=1 Tax=marine sediment metagenome TaxID=412755 RepID=A0A0F9K4L9_9ZZZZ
MSLSVWIKPAGTETWHLFQKNLPAALCGIQFEGIAEGPKAIVPDGEVRCGACTIADAALFGSSAISGVDLSSAIFDKAREAIDDTVDSVIARLFFQQHSAAALGAILSHPEKHGVLMIDDNEIEHVNLTEAAHLAHVAASEAWASFLACAEHGPADERDPEADDDLN